MAEKEIDIIPLLHENVAVPVNIKFDASVNNQADISYLTLLPSSPSPEQILEAPFHSFSISKKIPHREISKLPLLDWLRENAKRASILSSYNKNKTLTDSQRNLLVRLVIEREHQGHVVYENISSERYSEIATEICLLFKSESPNTYYIPHKSVGSETQNARGKLIYHNDYMRRTYLRDLPKKNSINIDQTVEDQVEPSETIEFLKQYIEPWDDIEKNWELSYNERNALLSQTTIAEYFKIFPCLQQTKGYILNMDLFFQT